MNTKKIKRLVEKISSLQETHEIDGHLSNIEKDLMLSYIRDLYDLYAFDKEKENEKKSEKSSPKVEELVKSVKEEKAVSPTLEKVPEKIEVKAPIAKVVEAAKVEEKTIEKPQIPEPIKVQATKPAFVMSDSMKSLFNEDSVVDLSDKLAQAPVKDLSKAMGLNERIFTVQELFKGDQVLFKSTIEKLNGFNDFHQACEYLAKGIANDLDWDSEEKFKKASHFVKLVRRRYL